VGKFTVGQIVSSSFPFSDLSTSKKRPAMIVAIADFDNLILCQITSKPYSSTRAIPLNLSNFVAGGLPQKSFVRPDKLFTADESVVSAVQGKLDETTTQTVLRALQNLFK
jgi:mRNA interferase MazF